MRKLSVKYIGQTKRKIKVRWKNKAYYKNNAEEKSAIAKHDINTGCCFSNCNLLKEVHKHNQLDAYEILFIKRYENLLVVNNEPGPVQNSPLILYI